MFPGNKQGPASFARRGNLLWMDEILHRPRNPGMIRFPCNYPQTFWLQPWFHFVVGTDSVTIHSRCPLPEKTVRAPSVFPGKKKNRRRRTTKKPKGPAISFPEAEKSIWNPTGPPKSRAGGNGPPAQVRVRLQEDDAHAAHRGRGRVVQVPDLEQPAGWGGGGSRGLGRGAGGSPISPPESWENRATPLVKESFLRGVTHFFLTKGGNKTPLGLEGYHWLGDLGWFQREKNDISGILF